MAIRAEYRHARMVFHIRNGADMKQWKKDCLGWTGGHYVVGKYGISECG